MLVTVKYVIITGISAVDLEKRVNAQMKKNGKGSWVPQGGVKPPPPGGPNGGLWYQAMVRQDDL